MEFFDGRKAGAGSSGSSLASKRERKDRTPAFVVTNLSNANARRLYEDVYCRRGQAENHIKSWKPIWRRIARHAPGRQPTSFGSSLRARTC